MQSDNQDFSAPSDSEEEVIHSGEPVDRGGKVPIVVPSRAWVGEVKMLKKGTSTWEQGARRELFPPFWANRYKVSKFGRDRAVELHRAKVQEDPQYGRRAHELSGKRLLCHCRTTEKCHAENVQDLFWELHPHAFDPSSSKRPALSRELNVLAKAREDREEEAEANAPPGTGNPMVIGSGYVERRLCDGEGLCSPGAWAPEDRNDPSSQLWKSLSRLFLGSAESVSTVQFLSELALGRHAKSPLSQDVVERLRSEVKVILAREGIQIERVEGDRTDVPINFRLLGRCCKLPQTRKFRSHPSHKACGSARDPECHSARDFTKEEKVADIGAERTGGCE